MIWILALAELLHLHRLELKSSREKKAVWRRSRREKDCAWRGETHRTRDDGWKQDWPKPPGWGWIHRQTGPEVSESSSGEGESEKPFTLAHFIFRYKLLSAIRSVLVPLNWDMSMLGCRFLPRCSWSKMFNSSRAVAHDIRCCAFPALPQSDSFKILLRLICCRFKWFVIHQLLRLVERCAGCVLTKKAATSWLYASSLLSVSLRGSFFCSHRGLYVAQGCLVMAVWSFLDKNDEGNCYTVKGHLL